MLFSLEDYNAHNILNEWSLENIENILDYCWMKRIIGTPFWVPKLLKQYF